MPREQGRITPRDIYKSYWKCRDLEISMLWTRLTLLGAFMGLTYVGYGTLILKSVDGIGNWDAFHLVAIGASGFGLLFSILWTMTAKGSKAWFERYEAMLAYFQETYKDLGFFERMAGEDLVLSYLDYNNRNIVRRLQPIDSNLFSQYAGAYSVSKIPIVMGQVSIAAWGVIGIVHAVACLVGRRGILDFVQNVRVEVIAVTMVVVMVISACVICASVGSSALKGK